MAPIKFENEIKEKLEQRKLQPNTNTWKTLQERLDENDNKKNNKGYWWFSLAASFVGILIVSSFFFNGDKNEIIEPVIVETETQSLPNQIENNLEQGIEEFEAITEESKREVIKPIIKKENSAITPELKSQIQQKQKALFKSDVKAVVAQAELPIKEELKENTVNPDNNLSFEDLKLKEVVAKVEALKKEQSTVSDTEINALLDQAQKEITLHKLYNETTKKVDATALLQDVETDLEQSFRERAFKAIKSGYHYVKTSVAERNN